MIKAAPALQAALDLATERHDEATRQLAAERARAADAEKMLLSLDAYRGDYIRRLRETAQTDTYVLSNFHRFVAKLDVARRTQRDQVDRLNQATAQALARWQDSFRKVKSLEMLIAKRAAEAALRSRRLEQKEMDEYAARAARRTSPAI